MLQSSEIHVYMEPSCLVQQSSGAGDKKNETILDTVNLTEGKVSEGETTINAQSDSQIEGTKGDQDKADSTKLAGAQRQSERLKNQGQGHIKAADKAEALIMKKNLEGLQNEDRKALEEGAEILKNTALHYHPNEVARDIGLVLSQ
ncbi:hypothetical protein C2845_PM05G28270 [Panicum miliaceum]|uniref:Uncharacterized protein n=1 Tax=Panicum miliaceum TaxID=4540 RepID=A0A3L6SVF5_PANMI|nr:hypothetical protein C2845_PM05G28270 [Panicum miliaceum]